MEIDDAALVDGAVELVEVSGEVHAMVLDNVRRAADACGCVVAVFCHFISCTGNDEAGCRGDVESVLAVTAGTDHIDIAVTVQRYGYARGENAIAETEQFLYTDAAHLNGGQQCCDLCVVEFTACDGDEQFLCLFTFQLLVVEEAVENSLDVHMRLCFNIYICLFFNFSIHPSSFNIQH